MSLLVKICSKFISASRKTHVREKANYVFYKIVDSFGSEEYSLQCINTSAIFHAKIYEIVFDQDILCGLHPIQACYIGIEYANFIKKSRNQLELKKIQHENFNKYSSCRYGNYSLSYQNRFGELSFINTITSDEFIMDPRDIALNQGLISEFDASQAFYIGLVAGIKINNPVKNFENKVNYLKIIK